MVKAVTEFQGVHTKTVIKAGLFESVMWPYLGKIAAPIKKVQEKNQNVGKPHYLEGKKPTTK